MVVILQNFRTFSLTAVVAIVVLFVPSSAHSAIVQILDDGYYSSEFKIKSKPADRIFSDIPGQRAPSRLKFSPMTESEKSGKRGAAS